MQEAGARHWQGPHLPPQPYAHHPCRDPVARAAVCPKTHPEGQKTSQWGQDLLGADVLPCRRSCGSRRSQGHCGRLPRCCWLQPGALSPAQVLAPSLETREVDFLLPGAICHPV